MSAPAGPCEWCGGPQHWTLISGEVYVSCDSGCIPLEGLGLTPPTDAKELRRPEGKPKMEHSFGGSVGPPEGRETKTSDKGLEHVAVPTAAFLETLWEGMDA